MFNEILRYSQDLFSSDLPGVRCLVPAYMQKIEEALKSDKVKIDREYSVKILSQLVCVPRNFTGWGDKKRDDLYITFLYEKIDDLTSYIFFNIPKQYSIQLELWTFAVHVVDCRNFQKADYLIKNMASNIKYRCEYIANEQYDPSLWSTDILVMIDVINYLVSSFSLEAEADFRKRVINWITTLFGCFVYVNESNGQASSFFYMKNFSIVLNNVILCIYNLLMHFPSEVENEKDNKTHIFV